MSFALALFVAGAGGFIALSYEILWFRIISYATQGAACTFGVVLGFYLLGVALGARRAERFCNGESGKDRRRTLRALGLWLFAANAVACFAGPVASWLAPVATWALSLLVVALATELMGVVLPLTSHLAVAPDDQAGAGLSYLYVANILGSTAGTLVTGFFATDVLSTRGVATLLACFGFGLAWLVLRQAGEKTPLVVALGALVVLGTYASYDGLYERLLFEKDYRGQRFVETVENRDGVINVSNDGRVWGGGVYDGAINVSVIDDANWVVRAFAVSGMRPRPKRMLMIGLASGSWAEVLAAAPGLEHFTIVEINPGYLDVIRKHPEVRGILDNPKVDIVIDDGRRWLLAHPEEKFDVVVQNTTWHWRAHTTNLLSIDFFHIVRDHLNPGGLFYFNTTWSADACKTAVAAFPHTYRVMNFIAGSDAPISIDLAAWRELLLDYRIEGRKVIDMTNERDRSALDRLVDFALPSADPAHTGDETNIAASDCAKGEVVTDDNMLPEWSELRHNLFRHLGGR